MENNIYALLNFKREYTNENDKEGTQKFQTITFYKLNENGTYENGTTLEEILKVCIEKLTDLNKKFACKENVKAISCLKKALKFLDMRTTDRIARGVEGKHQK